MKFISYQGYIKFYPENSYENLTNINKYIIPDTLVKFNDYWTFENLLKIKRQYLIGEKILGQFEVKSNIETTLDKLENIFISQNVHYNPLTKQLYIPNKDIKPNLKTVKNSYAESIPLTDDKNRIIMGRIENQKVFLF